MRAALVAVLVGTAAAPVHAQPGPRPSLTDDESLPKVAVVVEVAVGVDAARARDLARELAAALSARLMVDSRGGEPVIERLPPGGLPDGCLARPACVTDVARRLEVDELLFIALVQLGDQLQIDASWTDAGGTRTVSRPQLRLLPGDDPAEVFRDRAITLLPDARLRRAAPSTLPVVPPRGRRLSAPTVATAAIAAVGLGAGIGLGLSTRSSYLACERDGCDADARDAIRTRGLLADVSFGVAAVAAVTSVVFYLRSAPSGPPPVGVELAAGGRGAALVLGGTF